MTISHLRQDEASRDSALDMESTEFREAGHALIDRIADFYESLPGRQVTKAEAPARIRKLIGAGGLPSNGMPAGDLLREVAPLLFEHSLHNGHPKFLGYISSSAAPLGALADLLAASVNSNVAKWELSPVASEIEAQTIRWLAELIGYPTGCGGILVSGGNAANVLGFIAARKAMTPWNIREEGVYADPRRLTAYVSRETHTWIDKAADVAGLGASGVRWIDTDDSQRMSVDALRRQVEADRREGCLPFFVVGTAGTVGTGAIDPLHDIAAFCREERLWMHVDGAYGAPAAALPEASDDLKALSLGDSVALDPHKWLYAPLEAACVLTRNPQALPDALAFRPSYYRFDADASSRIDYYQYGMQNSRGFRALKVWLGLRQAGREGYVRTIREDIRLAERLYRAADAHAELEARTRSLSIATFRYRPFGLRGCADAIASYLNELNQAVLAEIQRSGELFLSNAIVNDEYLLRACCVNFRTTEGDIDAVPDIVAEIGRRLDRRMRPIELAE
jgi:aromatic-L-amino-acid decarboxylase